MGPFAFGRFFQKLSRHTFVVVCDILGGAGGHNAAAILTSAGTHVDDVVGGADHVQVVLDDDDCRAVLDQRVENLQKCSHVQGMQPDSGLVEYKERIVLTLAVFRDTPPGYMADYVPTGVVARQTSARECKNLHDLLTTRDAWLLVLLYFSLVPTFLIANAVFVSFGVEAKQITQETAVLFVSAGAIVQVAGRFIVAGFSDKIGRKMSFYAVFAAMAVSVVMIVQTAGMPYAIAYCILSFAYGGGVTSMPSIISDRLGTANATQNIAFAELGTLLGSVASTALVNAMPTAPALALSGAASCALGIAALLAIYHLRQKPIEQAE